MVYFETKNPNLGNSLECLAMEDVGIHYGHLVYLTAISYTLWAFGKFLGNLVYFLPLWYVIPRKICPHEK
jgi:hypothetical protein